MYTPRVDANQFLAVATQFDGGNSPVEQIALHGQRRPPSRGATDSLRGAVLDAGPVFPSPGCTTITVYPHDSQRPSFTRRLVERLTF
ncbi:hypothetical protein [Halolamina sp.]|uniref:hypothetical protein n=1 Tax=Halolamina sp. TaxID=1940283 RepID=UPI00356B4F0D